MNFSYIDNETLEKSFVSVPPEQGGSELIPAGMPKPGVVHLVTQAESGMTGLYRFETQMTAGNGNALYVSGSGFKYLRERSYPRQFRLLQRQFESGKRGREILRS